MPGRKLTWSDLGRYFGYPPCCRRTFVSDTTDLRLRHQVSQGTGFVPCARHAMEIAAGLRTLASLVRNRLCPQPFPHGGLGTVPPGPGEVHHALDTEDARLRRSRAFRARVGSGL